MAAGWRPWIGAGSRFVSHWRRTVLVLLVVGLVSASSGSSASAFRTWCRSDPVVRIGDEIADIFVAAPIEEFPMFKVTGPTEIVIVLPPKIDGRVVVPNPLGLGKGEKVSFERSRRLEVTPRGIELQIKVFVPARDGDMPVRVEFVPDLRDLLDPVVAEGSANEWIVLRTRL